GRRCWDLPMSHSGRQLALAADFHFDPTVSSEPAGTSTVACTVSAHSRALLNDAEMPCCDEGRSDTSTVRAGRVDADRGAGAPQPATGAAIAPKRQPGEVDDTAECLGRGHLGIEVSIPNGRKLQCSPSPPPPSTRSTACCTVRKCPMTPD